MAKHVTQRGEAVLYVVIDLAGEVADGDSPLHVADARFHRLADASGQPAAQKQRRQRRHEHGGGEPEIDVLL